jgi:hypothetical protein
VPLGSREAALRSDIEMSAADDDVGGGGAGGGGAFGCGALGGGAFGGGAFGGGAGISFGEPFRPRHLSFKSTL